MRKSTQNGRSRCHRMQRTVIVVRHPNRRTRTRIMPTTAFQCVPSLPSTCRKVFPTMRRKSHFDGELVKMLVFRNPNRLHRRSANVHNGRIIPSPPSSNRLSKQKKRSQKQTDSNDDSGRRLEESGDLAAADALLLRQGERRFWTKETRPLALVAKRRCQGVFLAFISRTFSTIPLDSSSRLFKTVMFSISYLFNSVFIPNFRPIEHLPAEQKASFRPFAEAKQRKAYDSPAEISYSNCDIQRGDPIANRPAERRSNARKTKIQIECKLFFKRISTFLSFFSAEWQKRAKILGFWAVLSAGGFCGFWDF